MKVVIVGGVAGGATAAARLRRLDEKAEITVIERSGYVSYANCGLPYRIGGVIDNDSALTLQTPEGFRERFAVDVRVNSEAISIDPVAHTVLVRRSVDGSEYVEHYDKLVLSPGAHPLIPDVPGVHDPRIRTLRTVEDTLALRALVEDGPPRHTVVVGGGFIGLEMAENLARVGSKVTLVQRGDHVLPPLDFDMACQVHAYLREQSIGLRLGTTVCRYVSGADGLLEVVLDDGTCLQADLVILAVGVEPDSGLAREAGLKLGVRNAIVVDEHMRTSAPDIYAVGDAVQVGNLITGEAAYIPLAGPANRQGRIAADDICGLGSSYKGSQASSVIKMFDMTVASTGLNEKAARSAGVFYDRVVTFSPSHATYYPGATDMTLKVLFEQGAGRILGAQAVGFDGVDKRMDVIATALRCGMTVEDLAELELCYAPPFSSAKDPVNMAGFVAQNVRGGLVEQHHWDQLEGLPHDGSITLLDVRTPAEFARGHFVDAINIPVDELRSRLLELDPRKKIYVNCQTALRSYIACRILMQRGFRCSNLSGGYRFYEAIVAGFGFDVRPASPCGVPLDQK